MEYDIPALSPTLARTGAFFERSRPINMGSSSRGMSLLAAIAGLLFFVAGCGRQPISTPDTFIAAKALFEQAAKQFHTPSADAASGEKLRLQNLALDQYRLVLKQYPQERYWAAQTLLGMGNIYAAQTNVESALNAFMDVERTYPQGDWELLRAWKSAADLLWENRRFAEARVLYAKIVQRFDSSGVSQVVANVVRGSKSRLKETTPSV